MQTYMQAHAYTHACKDVHTHSHSEENHITVCYYSAYEILNSLRVVADENSEQET